MKRKTKIVLIIAALIAVVIFYILFMASKDEKNTIVNDFTSCENAGGAVMESYPRQCSYNGNVFIEKVISIKEEFDGKIVYEIKENLEKSDYEDDCLKREGFFNECGSVCAPDAEVCVMMCAYTCEFAPSLNEKARAYCEKENIAEVKICEEYIALTSSLLGGGITYINKDNETFSCPVVGPDSMSEKCREIFNKKLNEDFTCVNIC